jgi:hypothetical protein
MRSEKLELLNKEKKVLHHKITNSAQETTRREPRL